MIKTATILIMLLVMLLAASASASEITSVPSTEREGWQCSGAGFDFCLNFEVEVGTESWLTVEYLPLNGEIFTIGYTKGYFPFDGLNHFVSYENQTLEYRFGCRNCTRETPTRIEVGVYNVRKDPFNGVIIPENRMQRFTVEWPIWGDFDYDGTVTKIDANIVASMLTGKTPDLIRADFNKNGRVDIGDASKIACYVAGKTDK